MAPNMFRTAGCVAACFLVILIAAAPAAAQGRVRVNIPFAFEASSELMPAGQYVFERAGMGGSAMMRIQSVEHNTAVTFLTLPARTTSNVYNPHLTFEVLGGTHRLSEIWTAGSDAGAVLPRTKEQEIAAQQEEAIKTVALVFRTGTSKAQ
jgi:hypothetical protein